MSSENAAQIPFWVPKRLLAFINTAKTGEALIQGVSDDPQTGGSGYGLGEIVANRIIATRNKIPGRRFKTLDQLLEIDGFGEDKCNDMLFSFNISAAESFKQGLFSEKILFDNWTVEHHSSTIADPVEFARTVESPALLRAYVAEQLHQIVGKRYSNPTIGRIAREGLKGCYQESYDAGGHLGSFAWALWFYRFDQDNWFSFDRIRLPIEQYLSTYPDTQDRIVLHLFKGFRNADVLTSAISVSDLPVTVCYAERSISIWSAELRD